MRFQPISNKITFSPTPMTAIGLNILRVNLVNIQTGLSNHYTLRVGVVPGQTNYSANSNSSIAISNQTSTNNSTGGLITNGNTPVGGKSKPGIVQTPTGKIISFSNQGLIVVKVKYPEVVTPTFLSKDQFYFSLDPPASSLNDVGWQFLSVSSDQTIFTFQIYFDYNALQSSALTRSKIDFCILSQPSKTQTVSKSVKIYCQDSIYVPLQIPNTQEFSNVKITAQVVSTSIATLMTSNIFLSILLSSSLQLLWSFVNSLQLISYLPLLNLNIPSNLYYVLSLINGPLQFRLINTDPYTMQMFGISMFSSSPTSVNGETDWFNQLFNNFGYNSNLSILNLNNTFYLILIFPLHYLVILLLRVHPRLHPLIPKMKETFQYSYIITLLVEDFINAFICCLINLLIMTTSSFGDYFSFLFSVIIMVSNS